MAFWSQRKRAKSGSVLFNEKTQAEFDLYRVTFRIILTIDLEGLHFMGILFENAIG
jgi:hypothetical protein